MHKMSRVITTVQNCLGEFKMYIYTVYIYDWFLQWPNNGLRYCRLDCNSLIDKFFVLSSVFGANVLPVFSFLGKAKPSCSQCVNVSFLNVFNFCWVSMLLTMTLADPMRMDHTTLQSINTSMRNAWFCSALRGCICLCLYLSLLCWDYSNKYHTALPYCK